MALFQYPPTKHSRKLTPRQFKRYQTYKRFLQAEFSRVCVYCRQPDSSTRNLNFGVDHYRPKGIPRFAGLICTYKNLFYCCGECNSRKSNYWPIDEAADPYVVNPCDFTMTNHLRFIGKTGHVEAKDRNGLFTVELLQLNEPSLVQSRNIALTLVKACETEIGKQERLLNLLTGQLRAGGISTAQYEMEKPSIEQEIENFRQALAALTGTLPLRPFTNRQLSVPLP